MKSWILPVILMLTLAGCGTIKNNRPGAPTPDSRAAAEKLIDVLRLEQSFDSTIRQAVKMNERMIDQMNGTEKQKDAARRAYNASMEVVLKDFSWAKMKGMFVDIYAEVFTAEELRDITAFYESPEGQKFVVKQPELAMVTMQRMQGVMAQIMPKVQKETARMMKAEQEAGSSPAE